ncbi:hypothetical protein PR002_g26870 [Phytophthora rubi]|nr:hypothetical protein PR002_g26870 [Phytophthora rubi]
MPTGRRWLSATEFETLLDARKIADDLTSGDGVWVDRHSPASSQDGALGGHPAMDDFGGVAHAAKVGAPVWR